MQNTGKRNAIPYKVGRFLESLESLAEVDEVNMINFGSFGGGSFSVKIQYYDPIKNTFKIKAQYKDFKGDFFVRVKRGSEPDIKRYIENYQIR